MHWNSLNGSQGENFDYFPCVQFWLKIILDLIFYWTQLWGWQKYIVWHCSKLKLFVFLTKFCRRPIRWWFELLVSTKHALLLGVCLLSGLHNTMMVQFPGLSCPWPEWWVNAEYWMLTQSINYNARFDLLMNSFNLTLFIYFLQHICLYIRIIVSI